MSKKIMWIYTLTVLFASLFCLTKNVQVVYASPYTNIDTPTAYDMITNGSFPDLVVLDVRNQSEYDEGHIYMSILIPLHELNARIGELAGHENHEIIVYCKSGFRSVSASLTLDSFSFTKVYNMEGGILGWDSDGYTVWNATVHNVDKGLSYDTIQRALDAPETLDGHTIFVDDGVYYESVIVNKSVSLVGENRSTTIIDGNNTGTAFMITSHGVILNGFAIQNCSVGINAVRSNNSIIINNYVQNCKNIGILVSQIENGTIEKNVVEGTHPGYGININSSQNIIAEGNLVLENNFDGLGLLDSHNCTLRYNTVDSNHLFGIWIDSSTFNSIHLNNVFNNGIQVSCNSEPNMWDNEVEGNYWNDPSLIDLNHDGISDTPYIIDGNNTDNYPLMGIFSCFNTSLGKHVKVISNSTINNFEYFESNSTIRMYVSNMTGSQTFGFVRISIPHALMTEPYNITVDGVNPTYWDYNVYDNGTHRWIYFEYEHSTREIIIIPEIQTSTILPLLITAAILLALLYRMKPVNFT